ncbi:lysophosphatidic acid receptor 6-like [Salarias fasciatus]|nr:lysophosphatidic acid receptor 6-like [Salarias fasciatus]
MDSTEPTESDQSLGYAWIFGCIMALGLPLNVGSLWVLLRRHSLKLPNAVFMVNLTISDLLLVISLPTRVYYYATGTWPLSSIACFLTTLLFRDNIRTSAIFMTFISVDRLLAVVYPLRSRCLRTSSNAWKAVALAWLFVLVMNIPLIIDFSRQSDNDTQTTCFKFKPKNSTVFSYSHPVLVLSMLSVNIVCTAMVLWTLCNHLSDSARVNNRVNVMLIFGLNLVMFIVCFVPVSVAIVALPQGTKHYIKPLVCLATVNCCLDPLLYYFSFDGFWKEKENVDTAKEPYTMETKAEFIPSRRSKRTLDPPSV